MKAALQLWSLKARGKLMGLLQRHAIREAAGSAGLAAAATHVPAAPPALAPGKSPA